MQNDRDAQLTAICAALKPEIYEKLLRYSAHRCRWLARMGLPVDGGSVEEFVADAITDTVTGGRTWAPDACDLLTHLLGVIRSRTSDFFRRHSEIVVRGDDTAYGAAAGGSPTCPVRTRSDHRVADAELVRKLVDELDVLAEKDDEVQLLLIAYEDGHIERGEIARELGWTGLQFDNARRRLDRMLKRLPSELSRGAQAVLGGSR